MSKCAVRQMTNDDLEMVLAWRNRFDVRRYMYTQHEISLSEHQRWFDVAHQDSRKHLLIFEIDNIPFGFVNFTESNCITVADWGFYLAPQSPKGTGRQLGRTALSYAFEKLNLHKICGQALAYNERSIKFHINLGFQQEGCLRDQHFDGQDYHNVECFGLLASEWSPVNT